MVAAMQSALTREQLAQKLKPYGGRMVASFDAGFDLWEFGWGEAVAISLEDDGLYSKWSMEEVWLRLMRTKPSDWKLLD